jgi:hypothetical protein
MSANLHDRDFYQWTQQQTGLLRAGNFAQVDLENLIEEISSLGERDKREAKSRLVLILLHLLKWHYQPARRGNSWRRTINEQRTELALLLDDSPSLGHVVEESFSRCYDLARRRAASETGLPVSNFPDACPWPLEQAMDANFWPSTPDDA